MQIRFDIGIEMYFIFFPPQKQLIGNSILWVFFFKKINTQKAWRDKYEGMKRIIGFFHVLSLSHSGIWDWKIQNVMFETRRKKEWEIVADVLDAGRYQICQKLRGWSGERKKEDESVGRAIEINSSAPESRGRWLLWDKCWLFSFSSSPFLSFCISYDDTRVSLKYYVNIVFVVGIWMDFFLMTLPI